MLRRQTALAPIRDAQGRFPTFSQSVGSFSGFTRKVAKDRHMSHAFAPWHCIPFVTLLLKRRSLVYRVGRRRPRRRTRRPQPALSRRAPATSARHLVSRGSFRLCRRRIGVGGAEERTTPSSSTQSSLSLPVSALPISTRLTGGLSRKTANIVSTAGRTNRPHVVEDLRRYAGRRRAGPPRPHFDRDPLSALAVFPPSGSRSGRPRSDSAVRADRGPSLPSGPPRCTLNSR